MMTCDANNREFEVSVIADPGDHLTDEIVEKIIESLMEQIPGDADIRFANNVVIVEFYREARNFAHAVVSAIQDVERAGLRVLRVEPDSYVSISEIARRMNVTRQAISKRMKRDRSAPLPRFAVSTDNPLYDWDEVLRWLSTKGNKSHYRYLIVQNNLIREINQNESRSSKNKRLRRVIKLKKGAV